jgi:hypothetical protein
LVIRTVGEKPCCSNGCECCGAYSRFFHIYVTNPTFSTALPTCGYAHDTNLWRARPSATASGRVRQMDAAALFVDPVDKHRVARPAARRGRCQ